MADIKWEMKMHMSGEKEHSLLYRSEYKGKGIQCEIHTTRNKASGRFGKAKTYFFIDGDKREFKTQEELVEAVNQMEEV